MIDVCGFALDKEATTRRFFDICDFYGITNKDLITLFNISNTTVSYWRNGTRFPDWDKLLLFAYTVGLPLDVMIIGKKVFNDKKIEDAINNISQLKRTKYISELQKLLDDGKLDFPPNLPQSLFNPLMTIINQKDLDTTTYNQVMADIVKYGLVKNSNSKVSNNKKSYEENSNDLNTKSEEELIFKTQQNSEFNSKTETNFSLQKSFSLYIHKNCNDIPKYDENNILTNGYRIDEDAYDNQGKIIILRFRNGFLDGDEFDNNGLFLGTRPAVETTGHIEYWRKGCLHRDEKQPAVITKGFKICEYWQEGKRIK
jgi:transcriptional regulator with XRE-family HTH domain